MRKRFGMAGIRGVANELAAVMGKNIVKQGPGDGVHGTGEDRKTTNGGKDSRRLLFSAPRCPYRAPDCTSPISARPA